MRAHRRLRLEYYDLVGRFTVEFEPRADWRALWRCTRDCAWKLVGIEMEQRALAEGGYSDDYIAAGWLFPRRSGYVRAFSHLSSLQPVHGFAAETSALSLTASVYGIPLSTTHVISTSLMGVGAAKRQRSEMDGGRTDHLDLDSDAGSHWLDRIYSSAHRRRALAGGDFQVVLGKIRH